MRSALISSQTLYVHLYEHIIMEFFRNNFHLILLTRLAVQGQVFEFAQRLQQTLQLFQTSSHRILLCLD